MDVSIDQEHPSRNFVRNNSIFFSYFAEELSIVFLNLSSQAVLSVGKLEKGKDAGLKKIQVDVLSCHASLANREAKLEIGIVLEGIICELGVFAAQHVQTCSKKR